MKISKYLVLAIFLISLLAFTVTSQISQISITAEEKQNCAVTYYNQTENVYGYATKTRDTYGTCFNTANQSNYACVNGTESYQSYEVVGSQVLLKNNTECRTNSFVVSTTKGVITEKKEIDFSAWGVCVNSTENGCLAITCGSLQGGSARNGIFNGCDGGKSCQKFLFCQDGTKVLYKGAKSDFNVEDPTFHLSQLNLKEVAK